MYDSISSVDVYIQITFGSFLYLFLEDHHHICSNSSISLNIEKTGRAPQKCH